MLICFIRLESVNSFMKAIEIYTDMGKFTMAAKHHQTIGETYESEVRRLNNFLEINYTK